MKLAPHPLQTEDDYWRVRNFLRDVFLENDRLEYSWSVPRLDYWRWHFILTCQACESVEKGMILWENENGEITAILNDLGGGELRLHIHPRFRTAEFENDVLAQTEMCFATQDESGRSFVYMPVFAGDTLHQEVLAQRGYAKQKGWSHHWRRDLDALLPDTPLPEGYIIRSMGDLDEHPARSWASWRSFHSDEPVGAYDGDYSWFRNLQSAPLYRRDLDIVAVTATGEIASFCTIFYDDYTRSAVSVLVGTVVEHWRRGLGKAVIVEGMRRLKTMGCTRIFATAYDPPADALYGSVMQNHMLAETWLRVL